MTGAITKSGPAAGLSFPGEAVAGKFARSRALGIAPAARRGSAGHHAGADPWRLAAGGESPDLLTAGAHENLGRRA